METKDQGWVCMDANGKLSVNYHALYKHLKEKQRILVTERRLLIYRNGRYEPLSKRDFIPIIKEYMPVDIRKRSDWEAIYEEFATDEVSVKEEELDGDERLVPFKNGILDLETKELYPHDSKFLVTRQVNANYLPGRTLDDAPVFKRFMNEMFFGDPQELSFLLQYIGAILSNVRGWRFKKLLMLTGLGNSGKSKLREFVVELIGHDNEVSIDMNKIHERFGTSTLVGKRLAGSGDMSFMAVAEMNAIKELVGGDHLFAEYKGKDGFSFRYNGFLWFNGNSMPLFGGDKGVHVYERMCIIECLNVIPEEKRDPLLLDKLLNERDVIASIAVDNLKTAIENGYRFDECEAMKINRERYSIKNDTLKLFVDECCMLNPESRMYRAELNNSYRNWCRANGYKSITRPCDVSRYVEDELGVSLKKLHGYFRYQGIELREEHKYLAISSGGYYGNQLMGA